MKNFHYMKIVLIVLPVLMFLTSAQAYVIQMIDSPDSVFKVSLISERGFAQDFECKGYRQRNDNKQLSLFFNSEDRSDYMILNMSGYISMRIKKKMHIVMKKVTL